MNDATRSADTDTPQYTPGRIVAVWAAAALPMGVLGWIATPWLSGRIDPATGIPGSARTMLLAAGLVWQFVLVVILIRRETPRATWAQLLERLWLRTPSSPRTGRRDARLWLWLVLLIPLFPLSVFLITPPLDRAWVSALPFLAEPPEFSLAQLMSPSANVSIAGAWWFYALFLTLALFNTVLGEELLFRGLLLPRMRAVFGRADWLVNGVIFGCYHLHQPWGIPHSIVSGVLLFALPTRIFRSAWMGIAIHSSQSIYFAVVLWPLFSRQA